MSQVKLESIHVYPVKACRGITLDSATLLTEGIRYDREWMIVDRSGRFLTQRERPELARVVTQLDRESLALSVLGHGRTRVPLRYQDGPLTPATCWRFATEALDCGSDASEWLSDYLGVKTRLVRFPRKATRPCDTQWTGGVAAQTKFSDGFPLLVLGTDSVADLRQRMGVTDYQLPIDRFRANLIVSGLPAYEEDYVDSLSQGELELKLVKPCSRCSVPGVDQLTGERNGPAPLDTLTGYRMNASVEGATLGVNAIVTAGAGNELRAGTFLDTKIKF
jgi:uncharacterized protein